MDTEVLYQKFQEWIDQGSITYGSYIGSRAMVFRAAGEIAEIIHKQTSLHAVGFDAGLPWSLLLTNELIQVFGEARTEALIAKTQNHANDNGLGWSR